MTYKLTGFAWRINSTIPGFHYYDRPLRKVFRMKRKVKADLSGLCVASLLLVTTPAINAHAVEPSTPTSTSSSKPAKAAKPKIKYSNTVITDGSPKVVTPSVGGSSDGLSFETPKDFPEWAEVSSDGSVDLDVPEGISLTTTAYSVPVVYSDGSRGAVPFTLTVNKLDGDPKMNNQFFPYYGRDERVSIGGSGTAPISFVKTPPEGTKFALAPNAPSWSSIDKNTGVISYNNVTAPESGEVASVPVIVTYPDASQSNVALVLRVGQPLNESVDPFYNTTEVAAGRSADSRVPVDKGEGKRPLDPHNPETVVKSFSFSGEHPDWMKFTSDGSIVAYPPEDAEVKEYTVSVTFVYLDNTTETVDAKFKVTPFVDNSSDPLYPGSVKVVPGVSLKIPAPDNTDEGSKFKKCENGTPKWASVDPTGSVTVTLPKDAGSEGIDVCVADNKGRQHTFNVISAEAKEGKTSSAKIGQATEVAPPKDVAEDAKFSATSDTPKWVTVNQDGSLVVSPTEDVKVGSHTFHIGSSSSEGAFHYSVKIDVAAPDAQSVSIVYPEVTNVAPGVDTTIPAPKGAPEGTKFSLSKESPEWVTINKDGSIKILADKATPGDHVLKVIATFPDKSSKEVLVNFRVAAALAHHFSYPYTFTVIEGETLVTGTPDGAYPENTKFSLCGDSNPEWVSIDSVGSVTAKPEHTHGIFDVCVKAEYPDGTSSESTATFQVFPRELIHRGTDFIDPATLAPGAELPYFPDSIGPVVPADQAHLPAPVTESSKKFLAVTGANVGFLAGTALALVLIGGIGVFLARRKKA